MTTKEYIKSLGLTQQEVANHCGVTLRTVQNWVHNDHIPKLAYAYLEATKDEFNNTFFDKNKKLCYQTCTQ